MSFNPNTNWPNSNEYKYPKSSSGTGGTNDWVTWVGDPIEPNSWVGDPIEKQIETPVETVFITNDHDRMIELLNHRCDTADSDIHHIKTDLRRLHNELTLICNSIYYKKSNVVNIIIMILLFILIAINLYVLISQI